MNWRGEISKVSDDLLRCEIWRFWLREDATFELDGHLIMTRKTRRHKFTVEKAWSRLPHRQTFCEMERQEPDQWVKDEVIKKFQSEMKFV